LCYTLAMKRLLVIGGAGFIGVNTARHFAKKGWTITILDSLVRPGTEINLNWLKADFPGKIKFVRADIVHDQKILDKAVSQADVVIHLAAQVAVTTSIDDPRDDFMVNTYGTFNVLEAVRLSKNKPILLYASTNKVYGSLHAYPVVEQKDKYVFKDATIRKFGVGENAPKDFHSPYGCSKGAADHYVIDYARMFNLRTVVFRQSCIYGKYQFGVEDQGWLAWFVIAANMGQAITLFGNGKQVRDALYVEDLAELYEKTVQKIDKVSGEYFNVGGGVKNSLSLRECLAFIEKQGGRKIALKHAKVRAGDQPLFISDNRKLKKMLGWKPKTDVRVGLQRLIDWVEDNSLTLKKVRKSLKA
jgi:CDP-paratose 2-epimerase